ncbi:MAG: pyridoxamine 5'-phosphate oxidase [Betaproteobacteria bacterium RIFCSPLOWO2_02_FULL_65_24]|nr:MAG: pyridoxamine 5'-phosphate oxidase [Betaproteobacteria bacterium RIFCSPLOWO2_02_FULL_65_24]
MTFAQLRREYVLAGLAEKDVARDPFDQFDAWFRAAVQANVPLANAMALATVDPVSQRPSLREILLKGYDRSGFVFYTSHDSRKGRELAGNPATSLLFWWVELERQVRIEGRAQRVSDAEADQYFASRPLGSRLGAWASPQSETVPGRETLEARFEAAAARFGEQPPRPPSWGGFRVVPDWFEFWQGRENRLHDRIIYRLEDGGAWVIQRLAP